MMPPKKQSRASGASSATHAADSDGAPAWAVRLTTLVEEQKMVSQKTAGELEACRRELSEATAEIQRLKSATKQP